MFEPVFLNLGLMIAGLLVLVYSGVYVVHSLSALARFLGISEYTISFILLAIATTLPELSVGVSAAVSGDPDLSLGNVLGTNIVNITLILGLVAVISGKVELADYEDFRKTRFSIFLLVLSPVILLIDGALSRMDGIILLFLFLWNIYRTLSLGVKYGRRTPGLFEGGAAGVAGKLWKNRRRPLRRFFIFTLSVAALVASSYLVVYSASNLSLVLGLPEILIGILIVALGTSLPELSLGIRSAVEGKGSVPFGNLLGALVMNSTLVLGVTAVISPIGVVESSIFWISALFMAASVLLVFYFLRARHFLVRREGIALIFVYTAFLIMQGGINIF